MSLLFVVTGERQVAQELIDTREQVSYIKAGNMSIGNAKRDTENDIHRLQADLDTVFASYKHSEEKAKRAMVDAGRLADELRSEQDHSSLQEKAIHSTELSLVEMHRQAEDAAHAMDRGSTEVPARF